MKASDDFTLRAFLSALAQLEYPLDAKTQSELNQVASTLAQDDISAIKQLRKLAEQDPAIHERYNIALEDLYDTYQAQPRNKFLLLSEPNTSPELSQSAIDTSPTLELVKASHQVLASSESVSAAKRLYRLSTVHEHATDVFEDSDIAWDWLKTPNRALGGEIPLQRLETDEGSQQVETILGRIEYGVYS
jgi:putative toxin-antitoxin system antitoxin component (TIGR02293 family)